MNAFSRRNVSMNEKHKKRRGGLKITSQCFFLILAVLILIYVSLLERIDFSERSNENKQGSLPPAITTDASIYNSNNDGMTSYKTKPRLEEYIQGWNVTKNVNWLLDFSIVGFPKTGTSTIMLYLKNQTQSIFIFDDERCELGWNQHVPLLKDLYRMYQGPQIKIGIKCPRDLEIDLALNNYRMYFPETKFIVGVRNPIRWFESFYYFRVHNGFPMLPPEKLIGKCRKLNQGVCTNRADFSQHLSKIETSRKVFLYEINQLEYTDTDNNERTDTFLRDLEEFLELKTPLRGPMIHVKPGLKPLSLEHENKLVSHKIDICQGQYKNLRGLLQQQASESAIWILNEFLANPNVKVSSPDYFKQLLHKWHNDPCDDMK
jgi:hypothetical protein